MGDARTLYVILTANASDYERAMLQSSRVTKKFGDDVKKAGAEQDRLADQINTVSGRLGLFLELAATAGPALVPIGAIGVQAVSGLASMLGIAAVAAGVTVLAFKGMGDTLTAMQKAELEPTEANLRALSEQLNGLPAEARRFAKELHALGPELSKVQEAAATGFFGGGATDALGSVADLLPRVTTLVGEYGSIAGEIAADTAEGLGGEQWQKFYGFLEREGRPTLKAMAGATGDLATGMVELWQAMDPANDDFTGWLREGAADFRDWASTVDQTEGYEEFMRYLSETGPQVGDALGSVADMMLQVVEAGAPVGGAVLEGLTAFADVVGFIADTPMGPALFSAAAAVTVLNRVLKMTTSMMGRAGVATSGGGWGGVWGGITAGAEKAKKSVTSTRQQFVKDMGVMKSSRATSGAWSTREMDRYNAAADRVKSTIGGVARQTAKAGGAVAGLAFLTSGAADSMGMTNTATLGLAGAMAGPMGAAIGAGVGYLLDFTKAGGDADGMLKDLTKTLSNPDINFNDAFRAVDEGVASLQGTFARARAGAGEEGFGSWLSNAFSPAGLKQNLDITFGGYDSSEVGKSADALAELEGRQANLDLVGRHLAQTTGVVKRGFDLSKVSVAQMDEALAKAGPAMDDLGITMDDLTDAAKDGSIIKVAEDIQAWQANADSAAGRTDAFANSVENLSNDALSAAESASQMSEAMQALLAPALTAEEATDKWRLSLSGLKEELVDGAGFKGFSEGAMKNRDTSREYMNTSMTRLTAMANLSETTERDMAKAVRETRAAFIESSVAAGLDRDAVTARANAMGLTPALVQTLMEATEETKVKVEGDGEAKTKIAAVQKAMSTIPPELYTKLLTEGVPEAKADMDALIADTKGLTKGQKKILIDLQAEAAKTGVTDLASLMMTLENRELKVDADVGPATAKIVGAKKTLESIPFMMRPSVEVDGLGKADADVKKMTAGLTKKQAKVVVALQAESVKTGITDLDKLVARIDGKRGTAKVGVSGAKRAKKDAEGVGKAVDKVGGKKGTAKVGVDVKGGKKKADDVAKSVDKVGGKKATAKVRVNNTDAQTKVKATTTALSNLDKKTATTKIKGDKSNLDVAIASARASLTSLNGTTATTYIKTVKTGGGAGPKKANADGGFYDGARWEFANGGFGVNGNYYDREPMLVQGGADIRWAEASTGWEAYISGKPGMESRNRAILGQAASRLGYDVGPRGRQPAAAVTRQQTVVVQGGASMPSSVELLVDGAKFTAYVRGHASDVANQAMQDNAEADNRTERMNWS